MFGLSKHKIKEDRSSRASEKHQVQLQRCGAGAVHTHGGSQCVTLGRITPSCRQHRKAHTQPGNTFQLLQECSAPGRMMSADQTAPKPFPMLERAFASAPSWGACTCGGVKLWATPVDIAVEWQTFYWLVKQVDWISKWAENSCQRTLMLI